MADPTLTNLPNNLFEAVYSTFFDMWQLWILVLIIILVPIVIEKIRKDKKYSSINKIYSNRQLINELRALKPFEFEEYIANLFNKLGFVTEKVGGSYDGGIDVIANKDGIKHYIQCKKHISSQVSVSDVRDFCGALIGHVANGKGYFITTNKFTLEAEKFAENQPIELIDGHRLIEYIKLAQDKDGSTLKIEAVIEKCPQCEGNLIKKRGKYGEFFGCQNYPKCKFTKK